MDTTEATPLLVRERILSVEDEGLRMILASGYLLAGRVSEFMASVSAGDSWTRKDGKVMERQVGRATGEDATTDVFEGEEAYLFTLRTLKRRLKERTIGLPGAPWEPWTKRLWDYWKAAGNAPVFPFNRQWVDQRLKDTGVFEGLEYRIDDYLVWNEMGAGLVKAHSVPMDFKGLRHVRSRELRVNYHFAPLEVASYTGHSARTATGVAMAGVYDQVQWFEYFPKLKAEAPWLRRPAAKVPAASPMSS